MADLICLIPNHGYSDVTPTLLFVSWLNGNYYVTEKTTNTFKLEASIGGDNVQFSTTVTDGYVREVDSDDLTSTITGLEHLEGESVKVTADGQVRATSTVSGGSVTVPGLPLETYAVGKNYEATAVPMDLDVGGIGLASTKRINRVFVDFFKSIGGMVGTSVDTMESISTEDGLFTGHKVVSIPGGYKRDTDIIIKQSDPLPSTPLSITYDLGASND